MFRLQIARATLRLAPIRAQGENVRPRDLNGATTSRGEKTRPGSRRTCKNHWATSLPRFRQIERGQTRERGLLAMGQAWQMLSGTRLPLSTCLFKGWVTFVPSATYKEREPIQFGIVPKQEELSKKIVFTEKQVKQPESERRQAQEEQFQIAVTATKGVSCGIASSPVAPDAKRIKHGVSSMA